MEYLLNAIGISMVRHNLILKFGKLGKDEFCEKAKASNVKNAIGHIGTIELINTLCGSQLQTNRIMVTLNPGDVGYVISIAFRLEEGKTLSFDEINKLYNDGKILFYKVDVTTVNDGNNETINQQKSLQIL